MFFYSVYDKQYCVSILEMAHKPSEKDTKFEIEVETDGCSDKFEDIIVATCDQNKKQ